MRTTAEAATEHSRGAVYVDSIVDLTAIFQPETQLCVHPRPGIPEITGYLADPALRSWRGLRQVATRRGEGDWRPNPIPRLPGPTTAEGGKSCRLCIEVKCGIPLTRNYLCQRIAILSDPACEETRRFAAAYGQAHLDRVITWFRRAESEPAAG